MEIIYKCDYCGAQYNTKKEALICENSCKEIHQEEFENLKYHIIKFAYPRLRDMQWYKPSEAHKRDRLLFLMEKYLHSTYRDYDVEDEMFKLFGELLPDMWN